MSKEKTLGQYFTPPLVAQLMIELISKESKNRRILEPSAGKGIFLSCLAGKGFTDIIGVEIDQTLQNESSIPIIYQNFFDYPINQKFDIIIGNPPYIRWKNLSLEQRQYLSSSSFWHKRMNGLTDILQPFIFKSVDHLISEGELIFITPLFWMQTLHAEPLRRFLLDNGSLELVINLHETRIFPKANLNLVIFKFCKSKKDRPLKIVNYWQKRKLEPEAFERIRWLLLESKSWELNSAREGNIDYFLTHQPYNSLPWRFLPSDLEKKLFDFEQSCLYSPELKINGYKVKLSQLYSAYDLSILGIRKKDSKKLVLGNRTYFLPLSRSQLTEYFNINNQMSITLQRYVKVGDVVEIGNGMVSGLDKAFRLKKEMELSEKEIQLLIPVVKAKAIHRYFAESLTSYFLVKPGMISTEKILEDEFPSLYKHLKPFKTALEKRYQYNRKIPYWEWVFIRNYNLMKNAQSLICVPCKDRFDKRGYLRFALCDGGAFTTQDVTVLIKFSWVKESPEYITAFLNSDKVFDWVTNKGLIRGGVLEFSEEPLRNIPFRLINWNSSDEVKIHDKIKNLVQSIRQDKSENTSKISEINSLISNLANN